MPYADPDVRKAHKEKRRLSPLQEEDYLAEFRAEFDKKGVKKPLKEFQIALIEEHMRYGMSFFEACLLAGVGRLRVQRAMRREPSIAKRLMIAQHHCKAHHVKRVYNAEKNWQASAWFLERVFRREFALSLPEAETEERAIKTRKIIRKMQSHQPAPQPLNTPVAAPSPLPLPERIAA